MHILAYNHRIFWVSLSSNPSFFWQQALYYTVFAYCCEQNVQCISEVQLNQNQHSGQDYCLFLWFKKVGSNWITGMLNTWLLCHAHDRSLQHLVWTNTRKQVHVGEAKMTSVAWERVNLSYLNMKNQTNINHYIQLCFTCVPIWKGVEWIKVLPSPSFQA